MNRRGIRAFSFGIIFSVCVLGTYYYYFAKDNQKDLNVQSAKQFLQNQGYKIITAKEYDQLDKKASKISSSSNTQNSTAQNPVSSQDSQNKVIAYQLIVVSGMSSSDITKLLFDNHIIEDEKGFEQFLISHQLQSKMQMGTYNLSNNMDFKQIAAMITKTKIDG